MINRVDGWDVKLAEYVRAKETATFSWGHLDCTLFTAGAVEAMTGVDHAKDFRGTYLSPVGAYKVLEQHGGVHGLADSILGERVPPLLLKRGDVAAVPSGYSSDALGVVALCGREIVLMRETGTARVPLSTAKHGWHV